MLSICLRSRYPFDLTYINILRRLALDFRLNQKQILHHIHSSYREPECRGARREEPASDETLDDSHVARMHGLIERFNHWIERAQFPINKLSVAPASHGMRLGTFAKERIEKDDVYLRVPPKVLMNQASAIECPVVGPFIQLIRQKFNGKSDPRHEVSRRRFAIMFPGCVCVLPCIITVCLSFDV